MEIVKCITCISEKEDSEVVIKTIHTKPTEPLAYYDKLGVKHIHNPDIVLASYICSRGHVSYKINHTRCPNPDCNWSTELLFNADKWFQ